MRITPGANVPTQLKLELSPGDDAVATGDVWTGDLEYSLDAAKGLGEDIAFLSWRPLTAEGEPDPGSGLPPSTPGNSVAVLTLQPSDPVGLILVKVPVFVLSDVAQPHVEGVKLLASTPHDAAPHAAEVQLMHGEVAVTPGAPAQEGQPLVFGVAMKQPLDRDLPIRLTLDNGEDDPATRENEQGVVGDDTGTQLSWRAGSGPWIALGADGVAVIPKGRAGIQVRVASVDDQIPEDTEHVRLSVSGVPGGWLLPLVGHGVATILASDEDVEPIRAECVDLSALLPHGLSGNDGVVPMADLHESLPVAVSSSMPQGALDARDVFPDDATWLHSAEGGSSHVETSAALLPSLDVAPFMPTSPIWDMQSAAMVSHQTRLLIEHV